MFVLNMQLESTNAKIFWPANFWLRNGLKWRENRSNHFFGTMTPLWQGRGGGDKKNLAENYFHPEMVRNGQNWSIHFLSRMKVQSRGPDSGVHLWSYGWLLRSKKRGGGVGGAMSSRSLDLSNSMISKSRWSVDLGWMIKNWCYIHSLMILLGNCLDSNNISY